MTNNDFTPVTPAPFGTQTLVYEPMEDLRYGPPPPPLAPSHDVLLTPPDRKPRKRAGLVAAATAGILAISLGSGVAGAEFATRNSGDRQAVAAAAPAPDITTVGTPTEGEPRELLAKVAAAVQPSVVSILVRTAAGGGEGSGVVLTADGTILTNNHVVEAGTGDASGAVTVKFADGKTAEATILGRDAGSDLAVIKAQNVSGLTPAILGDDSKLNVGDTVLAIGSPLGLEGSVSAGIVSSLHRPVALGGGVTTGSLGQAIQTDAPINPGNSGGALVDVDGHVIGINTAIATAGVGPGGQGGNIGVGFAIPITNAKIIADQLIKGEKPSQGVLGVQAGDTPSGGALVAALTPGGAAARSGLETGDIITAVGDSRIKDAASLTAAIRSRRPGESVELTYTRGGTGSKATVTLGAATAS